MDVNFCLFHGKKCWEFTEDMPGIPDVGDSMWIDIEDEPKGYEGDVTLTERVWLQDEDGTWNVTVYGDLVMERARKSGDQKVSHQRRVS